MVDPDSLKMGEEEGLELMGGGVVGDRVRMIDCKSFFDTLGLYVFAREGWGVVF